MKLKDNKKIIEELKSLKFKNFIGLLIAGVINAFGVILFLFPLKIYDSGISGVSMLLDQITPKYLTVSLFLIVLNVPIFIFGLKKQGVAFTIYSVFTVLVYSIFAFLFTTVFDLSETIVSPIVNDDLLLCAIFGGAISGVGSGLTIRFGGAIDGIDVLSVTFAKKIGISIGTFVLIFNLILYILCGIIMQSWILPLYSIVTYFVGSKTIDFIVEGIDQSKCAMIVTTRPDEILKELSENFTSSGTVVNAKGGYTKNDKYIIYFVINHFQIHRLKQIVTSIDKLAFISVSEVTDLIKNESSL